MTYAVLGHVYKVVNDRIDSNHAAVQLKISLTSIKIKEGSNIIRYIDWAKILTDKGYRDQSKQGIVTPTSIRALHGTRFYPTQKLNFGQITQNRGCKII
jgi:hypothetical protein